MNKKVFTAIVRHMCWVCFQMGAMQPYNIEVTTDQINSLLNGVDFMLAHPNITPKENHNNWTEKKLEQGWVYGEEKDINLKTHPDLVPFEELPEIEQSKDTMSIYAHKEAIKLWEYTKEK